ncbi:MAG TPA: ATP-binding protein, partial [Myxococcota bacterium]
GGSVPVQLRVSAVDDEGWLGIADDLRSSRGVIDVAEGRWKTVLDLMSEGLILATTAGDVRYWNQSGLRMHGFSTLREGLRSLPEFETLFALSTRDGVVLSRDEWPMPRVLRGEIVRDLELVISKRGTPWKRIFSYSGGIVTADSGAPMVFITVTDLTDRIEALALANRREEQLRTAHEAAGIGTWEASFLEGTATMSAEFARILGLPPDEIGRARNMRDFIVAADVPMMERAIAAALDPDGDGRLACEIRATRVDGATLWLRSSGRVTFELDAEGARRPARIIGAVVDITDVRQAERRLATQNAVSTVLAEAATLSEATPKLIRAVCESEGWAFGGIWEIDRSKNALRCAEMWHVPDAPLQEIASLTRTLSFSRGEGLVGRVWASGEAVLIEDVGQVPDFRRATAAKKAGLNSALAFPIAIGGEVIAVIDFLGRSITRTDGRLLEMFGVIGRQLGLFFERKRSEVERRTLETQLRQAQRIEAIGQLSGGIAHDFNNILAAIVGNAQLAMMDVPADHPAIESLEQIAQASARAKNLVQQILTFARQRPQQRQVIAAGAIVEESTRLLRAIIPVTVELQLTTSPDTPDILADATQVEQVIVNLGTNAWHALDGRPGKVSIDLRGATVDDDAARKLNGLKPGRYAVLSVSDTGRGMPADVVERIFEPFFTTRHQGKGTGLGLSVVHGIVQTHGGVIAVSSAPGSGTTFDIYLPDAGAVARPEEPAVAPLSRGTGQHILFVDDEAPLVSLNKRLLQHLGYRVTACTAPSAALTTFLADPWSFSAVLTDMNMPEISGLQLATEILRTRPDVPVLLASGFITDELQAEALRLGIVEVLHKPVSIAQLSEALSRALSSPDLPDLL